MLNCRTALVSVPTPSKRGCWLRVASLQLLSLFLSRSERGSAFPLASDTGAPPCLAWLLQLLRPLLMLGWRFGAGWAILNEPASNLPRKCLPGSQLTAAGLPLQEGSGSSPQPLGTQRGGSPARRSQGPAGPAGAGLLQPGAVTHRRSTAPPRPRWQTSTAAHGWQTQS